MVRSKEASKWGIDYLEFGCLRVTEVNTYKNQKGQSLKYFFITILLRKSPYVILDGLNFAFFLSQAHNC